MKEKSMKTTANKKKIRLFEVVAIVCPNCRDTVYSRARHDMRYCTCGKVAIDGGLDYTRLCYDPSLAKPITKTIQLDTDKTELYNDWARGWDKFGIIKGV